jgi:hypothetical protein
MSVLDEQCDRIQLSLQAILDVFLCNPYILPTVLSTNILTTVPRHEHSLFC